MRKSGGADAASERSGRLKKLGERLGSSGFDGALITGLTDIGYLTGFTGSSALLLVRGMDAYFFTDSRYTLQAKDEVRGAEIHTVPDLFAQAAKLAGAGKGSTIGVDEAHLTVASFKRLKALMPGVRFKDAGKSLKTLRMVKSESELGLIRKASALAEKAFCHAAGLVRPGTAEKEVATAFHFEALRLGAQGLSFDVIVGGGPRGALPHAAPGTRKFREGDLVVFDFGVKLDGYCSDQTMTLPVGGVSGKAGEVYNTVLTAQRAALAKIRPGVKLKDVDEAARSVIRDAGYGSFFGHGLGHGLGMEIHEAPTLSPKSADVAQKGMVFTVEPGIYLKGKFGVRLEELVAVTDTGCELVTTLPKGLGEWRP